MADTYRIIKYTDQGGGVQSFEEIDLDKAPRRWDLDFTAGVLVVAFPTFYACQIDSVTNVIGAPVTAITVNAVPYILGTPIAAGANIVVTVNLASAITLNISIP